MSSSIFHACWTSLSHSIHHWSINYLSIMVCCGFHRWMKRLRELTERWRMRRGWESWLREWGESWRVREMRMKAEQKIWWELLKLRSREMTSFSQILLMSVDHSWFIYMYTYSFTDSHINASQYLNFSIFDFFILLNWLETYIFSLKFFFSNKDNSSESLLSAYTVYNHIVFHTLSHSIICIIYYTIIHISVMNLLTTIYHAKDQCALVNCVCMDNSALCLLYYCDEFSFSSLFIIKVTITHIHTLNSTSVLIRLIIISHFISFCTHIIFSQLSALAAFTILLMLIQIYISENNNEITLITQLFSFFKFYMNIYDSTGLLTSHIILTHVMHLSADEYMLIFKCCSAVTHCLIFNSVIDSDLCSVQKLLDEDITVDLDTDVFSSWSSSVLETVRQTCLVSRLVTFWEEMREEWKSVWS